MTISGAGILIATKAKEALFLLRGPGGDFPGTWCLPGGHIEDGESALDAAKRETIEEIGLLPEGAIAELCRSQAISTGVSPDGEGLPGQADAGETIDFTTFMMRVDDKFEPKVSGEHVGFAWAPLDQPPQPLHPGVQIALDRLDMTELDAARAIADGRLTSPQAFGNMSLFAIRISGTGLSYRSGLDEYVWRKPEEYLNPEMQARWLGTPVVWEHPKGNTLTSKDYNDRSVGAIMLTYPKGDELWCIARIYDAAAIKIMGEGGMSTSPGVVMKSDVNTTMKLEDGSNLLVEGVPFLTDHLALVELGVWDKGGPATGVAAEARKDSVMADNEAELKARKDAEEKEERERADKARKDADAGEKLDKTLALLDSISKRMDAFEEEKKADKARKDAEEAEEKKADKSKKDGEDEITAGEKEEAEAKVAADKAKKDAEEEKKCADAARADSETAKRIAALEARLPAQLSDEDLSKFADAQARADSVMSAFGKQAPRPLQGETLLAYRRRLANGLKDNSAAWKGVNLSAIADDAAFSNIETAIYADSIAAAYNPVDLGGDSLREIRKVDPRTNRATTEFVGQPNAWMSAFSPVRRRVTLFNKDN